MKNTFSSFINTAQGKVYKGIELREKRKDEVHLVYVDASVEGGSIDGETGICIDIERGEIKRYMADYRHTQWWCRPFFGEALDDMPRQTQYLCTERTDGLFEVFVPVVGKQYKCVFEGAQDGIFRARLFSLFEGLCECHELAFVYAVGENPHVLTTMCVKAAINALEIPTLTIDKRKYPELFEYLGWCSWDAMQIRVCEEGLLEKCNELKDKEVPVRWAIIDDMWAHIKPFHEGKYDSFEEMIKLMYASPLYSFEADPIRFPHGLAHTIKKINSFGIHVGMWHPTGGYWNGIEKDGEAYKKLGDTLILGEAGYYVPDWKRENSYKYYKTIHDFFKKCGAEFIKVDEQSVCDKFYSGYAPVPEIARQMHEGIENSAEEHFGGALINCMGMASENIWSRRASAVSRCSDDFLPENREWFAKHILQCAYNSVFLGQFYYCDFDMWWTDDLQAKKNSVLRTVSGGPIYVSDKIGRTKRDILMPLVLSDGRILRTDRPAAPTYDCICEDARCSGRAIKLQSAVGEYGVMAVFNIDSRECAVTADICGEQIESFYAEEYAVYEHFSREVKILHKGDSFVTTLNSPDEVRLYIFAPVRNGFAAIGRADKFISPAAIESVRGEHITLKEAGELAYVKDGRLYIENQE